MVLVSNDSLLHIELPQNIIYYTKRAIFYPGNVQAFKNIFMNIQLKDNETDL